MTGAYVVVEGFEQTADGGLHRSDFAPASSAR